nr:MFS transporter [uncultured Duganella sp.]
MNKLPPTFRHVWIGATISQLGDVAFMLALPWLVLQMTGSSVALGSVMMALAIPHASLMLLGGAVSDRFPVRTVLAVAYTAQALCATLIAALLNAQALDLPMLYLLAACFGVADAFGSPALRVLVPQLLAPEQLHRANALLQSSSQLCVLAGSAVGGLLIAEWGLKTMFIVHAASCAYIIVVLLLLADGRRAAPSTGKAVGIRRAIADGLRYVWGDKGLRALMISFAGINFCVIGPSQIGLVVLAGDRHGSTGLGLLMSSAAAGSLAGLALAAKWSPATGMQTRVAIASGMLGAMLTCLALPMPLWLLCLDAGLLGAVAGFINVSVLSWLQGRVPGDMLGRVMSVLGVASAGITPLSLTVAGVSAKFGVDALFVGAGALLLLMTIVIRWALPLRLAPA